jgi:tetratricopeptide (TPR) repeat protein
MKKAKPKTAMLQEDQVGVFDKAVALLHAGDFAQAEGLFEKAASGPAREVSHAARVHARICAQKTNRAAPMLASAEDHYNYAVALINRRELPAAEKHLLEALELAPSGDYIHYALALTRGLRGEIQQACESLRRAIELDPRNRAQARSDPDFAEFAHQQPVAALLFAGKERRP